MPNQSQDTKFFNLYWYKLLFYVIALIVIALDQLSKAWASETLANGNVLAILPFLDFHLAHNYGAAFSMLSDAGGWQRTFFIIFSTFISIVLIIWILRLKDNERWLALALALILGGGIGNLIDRISLGYVVDFVSVFYKHYVFPTFNVADSAISVGAFMVIIDMLFLEKKRNTAPTSANDAN